MTFVEALKLAKSWVGTLQGVGSVAEGVSEGKPCITVLVSSAAVGQTLPRTLGPWRIVIDVPVGLKNEQS